MYTLRLGTSLKLFTRYYAEYNDNFPKELDEAKRLGFDCVDVDFCTIYGRDEILKSHDLIPRGLEWVKERGLQLNAIHLPFSSQRDYSSLDEDFRDQLLKDTKEMMTIANAYHPYAYVVHAGTGVKDVKERPLRLQKTCDSLIQMSDYTDSFICVENMVRNGVMNSVTEQKELIRQVRGCKNVGFCCDTNHYLKDRAENAIRELGADIKTLHISDHDYIDERHVLPTDGKIDWMAVLSALESIGYQGVFNYEIKMENEGYVYYTLEDVRNNYVALFERYNKLKER